MPERTSPLPLLVALLVSMAVGCAVEGSTGTDRGALVMVEAPEDEPTPGPQRAAPDEEAPGFEDDTDEEVADPSLVAQGEAIYQKYCLACHQSDGTGLDGAMATDFTSMADEHVRTDAELTRVVRDGSTGSIGTMPAWGSVLSDREIAAAILYIRVSFGSDGN